MPIETSVAYLTPDGDVNTCSIHPQGWVPIETSTRWGTTASHQAQVAFTPKGGCPLKLFAEHLLIHLCVPVAFTPKGGCPLKPCIALLICGWSRTSSIHPQGWVPIETGATRFCEAFGLCGKGSIHPQGWVPIETVLYLTPHAVVLYLIPSSIHPQGWVPIETGCRSHSTFATPSLVAFTPKGGCPLKRYISLTVVRSSSYQ